MLHGTCTPAVGGGLPRLDRLAVRLGFLQFHVTCTGDSDTHSLKLAPREYTKESAVELNAVRPEGDAAPQAPQGRDLTRICLPLTSSCLCFRQRCPSSSSGE